MQTTLGRKGDYSVRAVLDIANHAGQRRKSREIAEDMDIPARYLPQILANLVEHGILSAEAGPTGGYLLARPATDITLLDENISREHSIILRDTETGTYSIEDLQSTNGTKVNGKSVRSADLAVGDEIEIGHTRFKLVIRS